MGRELPYREVSTELREFPDGNGGTSLRYGLTFGVKQATFGDRVAYVWNTAMDSVRTVRLSLQMLFSGWPGSRTCPARWASWIRSTPWLRSPETKREAMLNILYFMGFIAINLAVMNMLPLPALDGGRIVCLLLTTAVEAITKKKINPKYEAYLHGAGMILLLGLMAVIMFKDIFTIIKR